MRRIAEDATVNITSGHGATVQGFSEGDPSVPRQGTQVSADFLNDVQESLLYPIDEAGLTPDGTDDQFLAALRALLLDVQGGAGQNVAALKNFNDGITATRAGTNGTAVTATGRGSGVAGSFLGSSNATNGGGGVSANGGNPTGAAGNGGVGATVNGGGFNAGATGNTTGAAGAGASITGGSISSDANGRVGGTGLIVSGGTGQAGRGKAIDCQHGTLNVADAGSTIAVPVPTNLSLNSPAAAYSGFGGPGGVTPCVWQDAFGVYHLEGSIVNASSSSYVAATGPAPATGKRTSYGNRIASNSHNANVTIMENGDIQIDTDANGIRVDLSGITYR